jgi:hypothetical protein
MTVKNALLASSAAARKPAAKATTKGQSKVEAEIERQKRRFRGNRPEAVAQKDTRADNASLEHHARHGDRGDGDDADADGESLAGDLLYGADAIASFLGLSRRQAFHFLQRGHIPATKQGSIWVASKSRLKRHYQEDRYRPPADRDVSTSVEA